MKVLVVMGVSGSGKSTIGSLLAKELGSGWVFLDGDDFHPSSNVQKMRSGTPLTDEDRLPWLRTLRDKVNEKVGEKKDVVMACSGLKEEYRSMLAKGSSEAKEGKTQEWVFIHLSGNWELIRERMIQRKGHFFKEDMLKSQFDTLEPLHLDRENGFVIDVGPAPEEIVQNILKKLSQDHIK